MTARSAPASVERRSATSALRSLWREPADEGQPGLGAADFLLVAFLMVLTLGDAVDLEGDWRTAWLVVGLAVPPVLLLRRSWPVVAVIVSYPTYAVVMVAMNLDEVVGPISGQYALSILGYSIGRWAAGRVVVGTAALSFICWYAVGFSHPDWSFGGGLIEAVLLTTPVVVGFAVRSRAHLRAHAREQARLRERHALARELHDTVAHHVSGISVQARAGLVTAEAHPESAREALDYIATASTETLDEMRTVVRALRDTDGRELGTRMRITDIGDLAESGARPAVSVETEGDLESPDRVVGSAAVRIVQESVANARRHAVKASRIEVSVRGLPHELDVTIGDDGERLTTRPRQGGLGLVGMQERAELLGGTLEAGPGPGRGWVVRAHLPVHASGSEPRPGAPREIHGGTRPDPPGTGDPRLGRAETVDGPKASGGAGAMQEGQVLDEGETT